MSQHPPVGFAAMRARCEIWGGEEKMMWHCGTHELGMRMGNLLEQIVFWG
jgi:hypothetical protein